MYLFRVLEYMRCNQYSSDQLIKQYGEALNTVLLYNDELNQLLKDVTN